MLKLVIVKDAGVASEALAVAGETEPLVHVTEMETDAPLLGTKSLLTVSVAWLSVFVIVQEPVVRLAAHVPVDEYPAGTGDSVAVQFGLPV